VWVVLFFVLASTGLRAQNQGNDDRTEGFRVLTWNVHLFGSSLLGFGGRYADDLRRVDIIGAQLARLAETGLDVVVLQEVWDDGMGDRLAKSAGFPYAASGRDRTLRGDVERTVLGSGLMILSRYPLSRVEQVAFPRTEGYDTFTSKGFLMCEVTLPDRTVGLVTTHLHTGGGKDTQANRAAQIEAIGKAITARGADGACLPYVIAGDFNTPRSSQDRYPDMLAALGDGKHPVVDAWAIAETTLPDSGVTVASFNTLRRFFSGGRQSTSYAIDYVFLRPDGDGRLPFEVRRAEVHRFVLADGEQSFGTNPEADDTTSPVVDLSDHLAVEVALVPAPTVTPPVLEALPASLVKSLGTTFTHYVDVFGVRVLAAAKVPTPKVLHAAHVLAQYIDNDEDGKADDPRVLETLRRRGAMLVMGPSERFFNRFDFEVMEEAGVELGQDLYGEETHPEGSSLSHGFDATLEEIWHLVSHGWAETYPEAFAFERGSRLAQAMDLARGGYHRRVPRTYPREAWYSYDDRTCDYSCQVAEYFYWGLTSHLGAQDYPGRAQEIGEEWRLPTPQALKTGDRAIWTLLTDSAWRLPTVLPDGSYGR
jgi:endonuclease/exonuclease/phosphatase family metal-dependent hydrolase